MNFLTLSGLSAAGKALAIGGAAAAVGALVAMYFLKLKRVRREVSSTFLWKRSVHDLHANSPFQRLRRNLLLFLQLLALLAALLALGRPVWQAQMTGVTHILLIDNSASMSATDVPGGRLAAARSIARDMIREMAGNDVMMVLSFATRPKVVQTLTSDRKALETAVASIDPTGEATSIREPLQLASSLAANAVNPSITVISDGAFGPDSEVEAVGAPVEVVAVGVASFNVGITAMDIRRNVEDPARGEIFAKVTNFSKEEFSTTVSLEVSGRLLDAQRVTIAPGGSHAAVFKVRLDAERIASVTVDAADDLAVDNKAWVILEEPQDIKVVLMGPVSPFLRHSLTAAGRFKVVQASAGAPPVLSDTETPVFVCEGQPPASLTRAGYIIFDAVPPGGEFAEDGVAETPIVIDVDETHPVTSFLELDDLYIMRCRKMTFPAETKVLVNSDEGPLVALSYVEGARVITVAFDPMNSRWPLRISYPMFIANAVNFLASTERSRSPRMITTGDVLLLEADPLAEEIVVTDPDGRTRGLPSQVGGTVAFGDTGKCGVYTVESAGASVEYVANLASAAESDIAPGVSLTVGSTEVVLASAPSSATREIWTELLLFMFVVLLAEWYVYNRRMYI